MMATSQRTQGGCSWSSLPVENPTPSGEWAGHGTSAGAARYAIWRRGHEWTAVADGPQWSAALAPRVWALRQRHWPLLAASAPMLVVAGAVALAGVRAWSPVAWTALLAAEVLLRVWVARQAGPWRTAALQRDGWQPVTRLRAISVADAVTTAQIRAGRPQR